MSLEQPIEIGKFFKNRKGDVVVFTGQDGITRPTKKGVALSLHKLGDLAELIAKARGIATDRDLIREAGE